MKKLIAILLIVSMFGCGTTTSLREENFIDYAVIVIDDSVSVTGPLLDLSKEEIVIEFNGVKMNYEKRYIKSFTIEKQPSKYLMQQNIVENTAGIAHTLSFTVAFALLATILVLVQ